MKGKIQCSKCKYWYSVRDEFNCCICVTDLENRIKELEKENKYLQRELNKLTE